MHVVVMGCGRVGAQLATTVEREGHSVSVIDRDPDAFRRLGTAFSGSTVTGVGFDKDTLLEAGVDRAAAFAAVSSGDNSNIISARVARETFSVERVVARIYDPGRAEIYERLGVPTVATVRWTVDRVHQALLPQPGSLWRDPTGTVELREVPVHPGWVGRAIRDLESATGARVAYLLRDGRAVLPDDVIQAGDAVHLLVAEDSTRLSEATSPPPDRG